MGSEMCIRDRLEDAADVDGEGLVCLVRLVGAADAAGGGGVFIVADAAVLGLVDLVGRPEDLGRDSRGTSSCSSILTPTTSGST